MKAKLVGLNSGRVIEEHQECGPCALERLVDWFNRQGSEYECIIIDDDGEVLLDLFP